MKTCPLCEGSGVLTRKSETETDVKRHKEILSLRKKGMSLREIGAVVGLAPNSVLYQLNKKN
jgi:DNA-binding CsgD family transcriptional regulator